MSKYGANKISFIFLLFTTSFIFCQQKSQLLLKPVSLSKDQMLAIGNKIWFNESKMSIEKLTWWNKNEDFASLGIGHFIWYPSEQETHYTQTFPGLLVFLEKNGVKIPAWLQNKSQCCPWKTREDFFKDINSSRMIELRTLLASTTVLQTQFIIGRTSRALDLMLQSTPKSEHRHIKTQFQRVANSATGLFAIIDYINFKGEGINPDERHEGQGWGLLQVLQSMKGTQPGMKAVEEFTYCAKFILTKRVKLSEKGSHEAQFLAGWKKRVDGYMNELIVIKT